MAFHGLILTIKSMSPTQRSLKTMRDNGYTCQIVERYNMFAHKRQDLFNCIDIVCMQEGKPLVGVQTTSNAHLAEHEKKILSLPTTKMWLSTGAKIVLHGWSKKGKKGKRKLWQLTEKEIHENS